MAKEVPGVSINGVPMLWIAGAYNVDDHPIFGVFSNPTAARDAAVAGALEMDGVPCIKGVRLDEPAPQGLRFDMDAVVREEEDGEDEQSSVR